MFFYLQSGRLTLRHSRELGYGDAIGARKILSIRYGTDAVSIATVTNLVLDHCTNEAGYLVLLVSDVRLPEGNLPDNTYRFEVTLLQAKSLNSLTIVTEIPEAGCGVCHPDKRIGHVPA